MTVAICFCNAGFVIDPADNTSCVDRDECTDGVCSHSCINTNGSFACTCFDGHVLASDQRTCTPCRSLRYGPACSRTCQCGGRGVDCHPVRGCVCQDGWTGSDCQTDIDECVEKTDACPEMHSCLNTNGSFICNCLPGYVKDAGSNTCMGKHTTLVMLS